MPEGKYLLKNATIDIDDKRVSEKEAYSHLKQKPNVSIFWIWKLNLGLYNLSGKDEQKKFNQFLRNTGEAPVIYDSLLVVRSAIQLERFMKNKGFYDAQVSFSTEKKRKKIKLHYDIKSGEGSQITRIYKEKEALPKQALEKEEYSRQVEDSTALRQFFIKEELDSKIKEGALLDVDLLQEERSIMLKKLRNSGYYDLKEEDLNFFIDTNLNQKEVNLYYGIQNQTTDSQHKKYRIHKLRVNMAYSYQDTSLHQSDQTMDYKGVTFLFKDTLHIKPQVILNSISILDKKYFSLDAVNESYTRLRNLQQFEYINIKFEKEASESHEGLVNCEIQLSPMKKQAYGVEATATLNQGSFGIAGALEYEHRNLFGGAEIFRAQVNAGTERLRNTSFGKFNTEEYGAEVSVTTPKFLLPLLKMENIRKHRQPRTSFTLLHNFNNRPEYRRSITDFSLSYKWNTSEKVVHIFSPLDVGILQVEVDTTFFNNLNEYYQKTSYTDHILSTSRYSLIYNNRTRNTDASYDYFRFNLELAGNLLSLFDRAIGRTPTLERVDDEIDKYYTYFGIKYAQYLKFDIDYSHNQYLNPANRIVYHFFGGIGIPYGNSSAMPFEKQYFAGGSNSMRAWQPRTLGPGTSLQRDPENRTSYGELKLETNLEYRFNITGNLEGACFFDVGNVWNISKLTSGDEESRFKLGNFYKQLAVGTGIGLRYNIDYLVLRLDTGLKVVDPYQAEGERFVPANRGWNFDDFVFNFGIGYPF